jgi:hypothetical protein
MKRTGCFGEKYLTPVLLLIVLAASWSTAEAVGTPTISNQCGVECIPCLGPGDVFCSGPGEWPVEDPPFCLYCKPNDSSQGPGAHCENVPAGVTGYPSCTTVFQGTTPTSCRASGRFCSVVTALP